VDPDLALKFAVKNKWKNAIKITKKFLISELTDEQRLAIDFYAPGGFEHAPERESMTIKTGVE